MRRGLFLAPFDELADARLLAELAARAEARGWDGIFLWDHIQYPEAVAEIADAWTTLAAIATATERVRIGALVTPLARRRPWVVARQALTLDHLSGGRLVLGFGVGGDSNGEMAEFGEEPEARRRAEMLDEGLELLTTIMAGEPIDHRGSHFTVRSRAFRPLPVQRPRIPIWLGARWSARRPIERAARWDGVFPLGLEPAMVGELAARIVALRPAGAGGFELVAAAPPGADPRPWAEAGLDWLLTTLGPAPLGDGGPDEMLPLGAVRAAIDAGPS